MLSDILVPQILNWEYPGCMSEEQRPPGVGVPGAGQISQGGSAEVKVRDAEGNLVALGTGAFRVFVKN